MRRGVVAVAVCAVMCFAPSAFALGIGGLTVTADSAHNVTILLHEPIAKCIYPKHTGGEHTICFTMRNDEYLKVGPDGIIWTPAHSEDFYDTKTGNHFTGQDPGTLDQPL